MRDHFFWKQLDKQVFHVTSVKNYQSILNHGAVLPNSGEREATFKKSEISYAMNNGYVSLFDFCSCSDDKIKLMEHIWIKIVAKHQPTITILFDIENLNDQIIPNTSLGDRFKDPGFMATNYYVPHVEAWYPEPVGVGRFKRILKLDWQRKEVSDLTQESLKLGEN